jgi:H+/Cl- antiporter ClcA
MRNTAVSPSGPTATAFHNEVAVAMSDHATSTAPTRPVVGAAHLSVLAAATVVTGVGAGLGGMSLVLLLHAIQHVAYGYSLGWLIGPESFLDGVRAASPLRRVAVLEVCGAVAGIGWWAVYRFGRPLVSIRNAVAAADPRLPGAATIAHALLQIITVALGSPLGREVAPREIGALIGGWIARTAQLSAEEARTMLACGAGAGLAAVYNVPLGGALFVMEVLLRSFAIPVAIPALATSVIAAMVAWIGLGNETQYTLPHLGISPALIVWSILTGPAFGWAGWSYARLTRSVVKRAPRDHWMIVWCVAVFSGIGLLATRFPELLGNGKGPIQLGLDGDVGLRLAIILLGLKVLATVASLRAGAAGGLLTPGLSIGALLAIVLGTGWNQLWPLVPTGAFAMVGAAAFLAVSMRMPLTAVALVFALTRADQDFLVPVLFAVAGALATSWFCERQCPDAI